MTGMLDSCPLLTVLGEAVFKSVYKIVQSGASLKQHSSERHETFDLGKPCAC